MYHICLIYVSYMNALSALSILDLPEDCTISLKGIVQRKGPVALPSSGRSRTIWLSGLSASPEPLFLTGKFGVVVKV